MALLSRLSQVFTFHRVSIGGWERNALSLGIPNVYKRVEIMSKRDEDILIFIFIFSRSLILREIPECDSGFIFSLVACIW